MNFIIQVLAFIPIFIVGIISTIISLTIRFKNPELTETQLFLKFWKTWVSIMIFLFLTGLLAINTTIIMQINS